MENNTDLSGSKNGERTVLRLSITDVLALLIVWSAVLAILALCRSQGFVVLIGLGVACYLSTMIITKKSLSKFWSFWS